MTLAEHKISYIEGLVSLYHLLINADGHVDEKEVKMGKLMIQHEEIDNFIFERFLEKMSKLGKKNVIEYCVNALGKCSYELKVKSIAWMSLVANSDGFMDPEEWKLIYQIYNKELKLDLNDILEVQKQLRMLLDLWYFQDVKLH